MTHKYIQFYTFIFLLAHPVLSLAQHNDIQFDYQANKIDIKANLLTGDLVGLGDFPTSGLFKQFTQQPGFASETDVGLGIDPFDTIVYNVLDDLLFWDGVEFSEPDASTHIRIDNNGAPDTFVSGLSGQQPGGFTPSANRIDQADGAGFFHGHVDFHLEPKTGPAPEIGAYGLKLSLSTDAVGIADSDPFLAVFNFGLDTVGFDNAVDEFSNLLAPDLLGDYNRSGAVNNDDYLLWQEELGTPPITSGSGADGNSDGVVGGTDFLIWQNQFGSPAPAAAAINSFVVPEPSTMALVACVFGGLFFSGCRRTRRQHV